MKLELKPYSGAYEEVAEVWDAISEANIHLPLDDSRRIYTETKFSKYWEPEVRETYIKARFESFQKIKDDPTCILTLIVDADQNDLIVGLLFAAERTEEKPEPPKPVVLDRKLYDTDADFGWATYCMNEIGKEEHDILDKIPGKVIRLASLNIHPDYQGKGAGSQCVKLVNARADAIGAKTFVSTAAAVTYIYEKHGFKPLTRGLIRCPEEFGKRPDLMFDYLLREPQASAGS